MVSLEQISTIVLDAQCPNHIATFLRFSVSSINIVWRVRKATALEISCPNGLTVGTNNLAGNRHERLTSMRLPAAAVTIFLRGDTATRSWMKAAAISGDTFLDVYSSPKQSPRTPTQSEFIQSQDIITNRTLWVPRGVVHGKSVQNHRPSISCDDERIHHINGLHLPQMQPCISAPEKSVTHPMASETLPGPRIPRSRLLSQSSISDGDGVSDTDRDAQLA